MTEGMLVICPTRGRPGKAQQLLDTFNATRELETTRLIFVVDLDDPERAAYEAIGHVNIVKDIPGGRGMGDPLNHMVRYYWEEVEILGFVGDDHRFRTPGWDRLVTEALRDRPGFAYGNDTVRSDIPTSVFISAPIVEALGWMALPGAHHLYLDNAWAHLGHAADCITYLPAVVIEHMHPSVGKSVWDEGYTRVNSSTMYAHDAKVFGDWLANGAETDIAIVKETIRAIIIAGENIFQ